MNEGVVSLCSKALKMALRRDRKQINNLGETIKSFLQNFQIAMTKDQSNVAGDKPECDRSLESFARGTERAAF